MERQSRSLRKQVPTCTNRTDSIDPPYQFACVARSVRECPSGAGRDGRGGRFQSERSRSESCGAQQVPVSNTCRRGDFAEEIDGLLGGFCGEHRGENRRENRGDVVCELWVFFWRAFCLRINNTNTTSNIQKSSRNPPEIHPKIQRTIHPQFAKLHAKLTLQALRRDTWSERCEIWSASL